MYFLLFCTLFIALSEATQPYLPVAEKLVKLMLEKSPACVAATGAHPDAIEQFFTIPLLTDERSKNYNFCLFKNMGLCDDAGHMYVDRVVALYDNSDEYDMYRVARTSSECNQIVAENPVETLNKALLCFSYRAPAWIPS